MPVRLARSTEAVLAMVVVPGPRIVPLFHFSPLLMITSEPRNVPELRCTNFSVSGVLSASVPPAILNQPRWAMPSVVPAASV